MSEGKQKLNYNDMRTAEEILRKFVTIHTFGDVNATKASILQAMEEYANERVKAKCTIPVIKSKTQKGRKF